MALKRKNYLKDVVLAPEKHLIIYDSRLLKYPIVRTWLKRFPFQYGVTAGEKLKDLEYFSKHVSKIMKVAQNIQGNKPCLLALGGGSVGDFAGFIAHLYKRGIPLIQIPSTWLSAIDSAHGGKTALNVGGVKNQLGSFHFPLHTYLVRDLLLLQPQERVEDAFGEFFKMALLNSKVWKKCRSMEKLSAAQLFRFLPLLVKSKLDIVQKDPHEKSGRRQILNLGHTMGHVFESYWKLPHGVSVNLGLTFALRFSYAKNFLSSQNLKKIEEHRLSKKLLDPSPFLPKTKQQVHKYIALLQKDKKRAQNQKLWFVFLKEPGRPVRKLISISQIIQEIQRQVREYEQGSLLLPR